MIQQLVTGLALALVVGSASQAQETPSQSTKSLVARQPCDPVEVMLANIQKYQEEPLFTAETYTLHVSGEWFAGQSMMFVNQDTGTYSFITLYPDGTACMQAAGTTFEPYSGPKLYTKQ